MTTHDPFVRKFTAAGDRRYRAECRSCPWHGAQTADKERADDEARWHGGDAA